MSDSAIARTAALQAPLSMGFSRQEYWSGLPFPSPGDLPDSGIEPGSPALHADSLPPEPPVGCIKRVCEASRIEKNLQIIVNISVYHFISSKEKNVIPYHDIKKTVVELSFHSFATSFKRSPVGSEKMSQSFYMAWGTFHICVADKKTLKFMWSLISKFFPILFLFHLLRESFNSLVLILYSLFLQYICSFF